MPTQLRRISILALLGIACAAIHSYAGDDDSPEARMRKDLVLLASDEYEGRGVGTKGLERAAEYIANEFKKAGLKPGGKNGSYFQPFTVAGFRQLNDDNALVLHGPQGQTITLVKGRDFEVLGTSGGGKVTAPIVFAGYGVSAPNLKYDDFKDVDVKGKVVVVIRRLPRWSNKFVPFGGKNRLQYAQLISKQLVPEVRGAAAVLLINDRSMLTSGDGLVPFSLLRGASGKAPGMHVKRDVLEPLFRSSLGNSIVELEQAIDRNLQPQSALLAGWKATVQADVEQKSHKVKNVVGVLEGSGPLAKETVVIGAHYDHLGYGAYGSRAKVRNKKQIHNGADDNASGTVAVMELARRFAKTKGPRRRLVFMAFSAEEMGLLGSRYYCKNPLFALKDTVAMVNLDMVGRLRPGKDGTKGKLIVHGVGTAKSLNELLDKWNKKWNFQLNRVKNGTGRSDHDSFYRKDIPVLFFFTNFHDEYHRPSDDSHLVNFKGLSLIAGIAEEAISEFVTGPRPVHVAGMSSQPIRPGNTPTFGFRPGYGEEVKGVLVEAVSAGSPAKKGGMKAGDVIVDINGEKILNIQTYTVVMRMQKRGVEIPVTVLRKGKKVVLKLAPR